MRCSLRRQTTACQTTGMDSGKPIADSDLDKFEWLRLIMYTVVGDGLDKSEMLIAHSLAFHADHHGRKVFPGNENLAKAARYCRPSKVGPILKSLREKGFIVQVAPANQTRGRSAQFVLSLPPEAPLALFDHLDTTGPEGPPH